MIDPRDPGTQQLQLEQKRGRCRPATCQALSDAERQRRYREAQKAQRNENMHKDVAEGLRAELAKSVERIEELESELKRWKMLATTAERARQVVAEELTQRNDNELMKRVELAEAERDAMGNELAIIKARLGNALERKTNMGSATWRIQRKRGRGAWKTQAGNYRSEAEAVEKLMDMDPCEGATWRVIEVKSEFED